MQQNSGRAWRAALVAVGALVAVACGTPAATQPAAPVGNAPAPAAKAAAAPVPQAAPAAPLPGPVQQEWDRVVAAAGQEGKVVVAVPPGPQYEPALRQAFSKAFPGIQIEMVNLIGGQFRQRVEKERAADQYDWDACICGAGADTYRLIAGGVFDPIKGDLILPEVLDDSKWMGGFDGRFSDDAKTYSFDFGAQTSAGAYVNRDTLREAEFSSFDQLWNPQFRSKIVWQDPRGPGSGVNAATVILHVYGEDKLRELWTTQQIQLTTDDRQMAEAAMRGTRPIAIGMVYSRGLALLHQEGLAQNVKTIPYPVPVAVGGPHSILAVNRPPHPNARKVFLNWLLTPEGQTTVGTALQSNSARLDVPIFDPESEVPKGVETINTQAEAFVAPRSRAGDLAREVFK